MYRTRTGWVSYFRCDISGNYLYRQIQRERVAEFYFYQRERNDRLKMIFDDNLNVSNNIINCMETENKFIQAKVIEGVCNGICHVIEENNKNLKKFEPKINNCNYNVKDSHFLGMREIGLFWFIFDYLEYEEIKENVSTTCKLFHFSCLKILDKKYIYHICDKFQSDAIIKVAEYDEPDMKFRHDTMMMFNAVLIMILHDYVDQIKTFIEIKGGFVDDYVVDCMDLIARNLFYASNSFFVLATFEGRRLVKQIV